MENKLQKKYGLMVAIAMVVGIVIGSGVFFKAEKILKATGGNLPIGILAWFIGGCIMIVCAYVFSILATRFEYVNGLVDYTEVTLGKRYAYLIGWFLAIIYYPTLTSVLAWVSARYLCVLLGFSIVGAEALAIAGFFLVASYALNSLSPVLAGKFQVSATIIKLVPLLLMAIFGTIAGLSSGMTAENFTHAVSGSTVSGNPLFTAVVATSFAYEGWIIATSINAELHDSKKNLPKALIIGTFLIMAVYILYYVGLAGVVPNSALMESGETGAKLAFETVFSKLGGTLLFVFIVISCLGTLNGLMLGCTRAIYSLSVRNVGPKPAVFRQVDASTNMPVNSSIFGLLLCAFWLLYFFGAQLTGPWFGPFSFDTSELPIVTLYAAYIPMFIVMMFKFRDLGFFKGFVMPLLAIIGSIFMVVAACFAHGMLVVWYLVVFAAIMIAGLFFMKEKPASLPKIQQTQP